LVIEAKSDEIKMIEEERKKLVGKRNGFQHWFGK
jgi:hypothetical protein